TRSSRQICLIGFLSWKYARRTFAIVSTTSIPSPAPDSLGSTMDHPYQGGPFGRRSPLYGGLFARRFTVMKRAGAKALKWSPPGKPTAMDDFLVDEYWASFAPENI